MKHLIASVLLAVPALGLIAPAHAENKAASKPAATKTAAAKKSTSLATRKSTPTKHKAVAAAGIGTAGVAATALQAPRALNADELALAERVHTGRIPCELGQHVEITKDAKNPGHFLVSGKGFNFHMSPVGTNTGVVRLEDQGAGAIWLQIANKSMLMNQKQGKRLADECMSPEQLQVAEAIKKSPPQSLLEGLNK